MRQQCASNRLEPVAQRPNLKSQKGWTMRRICLQFAAATLFALGQGCQTPVPDSPSADAQADASLNFGDATHPADANPKDSGAQANADVGPSTETATVVDTAADAGSCPGAPGCACIDNANCANTYCIDDIASTTGKACAHVCVDSCPSGYKCSAMSGGSGDLVSVCVATFVHLCEPCSKASDCQSLGSPGAGCIDHGAAGNFCGTACLTGDDCPQGYGCLETTAVDGKKAQQCAPLSTGGATGFGACACSAVAIAKKATTNCYSPVAQGVPGQGKCTGTRSCSAVGLTPCSATAAALELCNAKDDDCDGLTDEGSCDDGLACTTDNCQGAAGCQHVSLDGTPCNADSNVCTVDDACSEGNCEPGKVLDCDDKNACTTDTCDLAKGCTHVAFEGLPCDADGSACTAGDVCQGGGCHKGPVVVCDDNNPCTDDACDPTTGQCQAKSGGDNVPCDDSSKCTSKDACFNGGCKGKPVDCDDGNACTDDVCDPKTGCAHQPASGVACSDENPCTLSDLCKDGTCESGKAKVCPGSQSCIGAACSVVDGACKFANLADGAPCNDASACTNLDGCVSGLCKGKSLICDDKNPCTDDGCDPLLGCGKADNQDKCDDGNACTALDICGGGKCAGLALVPKVDCDDGNACTTDACDVKQGCVHTDNVAACEDGNLCTVGDTCAAKVCVAGANTCGCQKDLDCAPKEDGNLCNGTLFCDKSALPFKCALNPKTVIVCDTKNDTACLINECATKTGLCSPVILNEGKECDADGSVCTGNDLCKGGVCKPGSLLPCDDGDVCTTDGCDKELGCVATNNTAVCVDGNACTGGDLCANGTCNGKPIVCDDGNACTADSCDPAKGCQKATVADNIDCSVDGKSWCIAGICTSKAFCGDAKINQASEQCDDGNNIATDACIACKKAVCGDGFIQAGVEQCDNGALNANLADKCRTTCKNPACGDGIVDAAEECDDGNIINTDSCTNLCKPSAVAGQLAVTALGATKWVVPVGVFKISVVTIGGGGGGWGGADVAGGGGGGLAYVNDMPVTPGETLILTVGSGGAGGYFGLVPALTDVTGLAGGTSSVARLAAPTVLLVFGAGGATAPSALAVAPGGAFGGTAVGVVGFAGGKGNAGLSSGTLGLGGAEGVNGTGTVGGFAGSGLGGGGGGGCNGGGGGGAGGYGVAGGGGAGGNAIATSSGAAGGGGVGLFGSTLHGAVGGNGAAAGAKTSPGGNGGLYGGGGGGCDDGNIGGHGADGAVRILWQGGSKSVRAFPSTNVGNL